jgi:hypothetical protein
MEERNYSPKGLRVDIDDGSVPDESRSCDVSAKNLRKVKD